MDPTVFQSLGQEIPPQTAVDVLTKLLPHLTPNQLHYVAALMHTPEEFNAKYPELAPQPPASAGMALPSQVPPQPASAASAAPAVPPAAAPAAAPAKPPMSAPAQAALAPKVK
jgi:hypothetical protein